MPPAPQKPLFPSPRPASRGFALVIVLAFVALLVGVCLAFFSNSALQAQISNSSATQVKTGLLADGATDIIASDLKAEIAAGSNVTTLPDGRTKIYEPKTPSDMVPYRLPAWLGSPGSSNPLANLLKISGQPFHPNVTITDSGIDTTERSVNGRSILPDRWLKPLFLPSTVKSLPATPKWIDVTRDGSTAASSVVGRYAFVIYDEGGLLDLNVAGYPGAAANWDPTRDTAFKGALAYADLTIPDIGLAQSAIDALVNWRNAASLASPGYRTYVETNTAGFVHTANTALSGGHSDQMFAGRQQMLSLLVDKLGWNPDTLQYFTSFSRDINQPSLSPDHTKLPQLRTRASGGNDQVSANYDKINPKFPQVPVQTPFTRNDGTIARQGEPIVKQRFALSRLIWLTYQGPSQGKTGSDIDDLLSNLHVKQSWLDQGTADNIKKYFGLVWDSTDKYWRYDSYTDNAGRMVNLLPSGSIMTLAEVAATGREPNFFELLKASITTGALGKAGTSYTAVGTASSLRLEPMRYQYFRDSSVDYQVMQIGANIIDQSDVDGFPTHIRFGRDTAENVEFRGIENLPYLYRVRNSVYNMNNKDGRGEFWVVQQPEIWNPHSYDSTNSDAIKRSLGYPRPTNFKLTAYTAAVNADGTVMAGSSYTPIVTVENRRDFRGSYDLFGSGFSGSGYSLNGNEGYSFTIPESSPTLFREPTLLITPNVPSGSNLQGLARGGVAVNNVPSTSTITSFLGVRIARGDLYANDAKSGNAANSVSLFKSGAGLADLQSKFTYLLQCNDAPNSSTMRTYDEKYFRPSPFGPRLSSSSPTTTYDQRVSDNGGYQLCAIISIGPVVVFADPRTSRFGGLIHDFRVLNTGSALYPPFTGNTAFTPGAYWLDATQYTVPSNRPGSPSGWAVCAFTQPANGADTNSLNIFPLNTSLTAGKPGWAVPSSFGPTNLSNVFMFFVGLLSENKKTYSGLQYQDSTFSPATGGNNSIDGLSPANPNYYYSDPDGVIRRASGAYTTYSNPSLAEPVKTTGLPMAPAYATGGYALSAAQKNSRPVILNRPFRSVGELGYVFSDTPWKNLDFSTAESGFAPLLDAFCVNDSDDPGGLVAGKVNLNTRQGPVLEAILTNAYRETYGTTAGALDPLTNAQVTGLVNSLLTRTDPTQAAPKGPFTNLSNLVGRYLRGNSSSSADIDGALVSNFDGFVNDLGGETNSQKMISRYREAAIRALAANGATRTWNLMVDLISQSGRKISGGFVVDGEKHYWVHLAIDRYTGKVLDKQTELVTE